MDSKHTPRGNQMVANGNDDSNLYFRALLEWETEGEITPAQSDREPHEVVMDERTPALLRRQAA